MNSRGQSIPSRLTCHRHVPSLFLRSGFDRGIHRAILLFCDSLNGEWSEWHARRCVRARPQACARPPGSDGDAAEVTSAFLLVISKA